MTEKKRTLYLTHSQGFSLIELSIILTIFAILLTSLFNVDASGHEREKLEQTHFMLDVAEQSLQDYFQTYGFLPCPSRLDTALDSAAFGISTDCTTVLGTDRGDATDEYAIRVGGLPVKELGLAPRYSHDGWDNHITYVIIRELGYNTPPTDGYDAYAPAQATDYFTLTDQSVTPNEVHGDDAANVIGFVLISHGADKHGAFSTSGQLSLACSATTADGANCDTDKLFIHRNVNQTSGANYYYDMTRWVMKNDLDAL